MNIKKKAGVVSCSGECCGLGTLSRIATRFVLEEGRPDETVTICLPLFLAGSHDERTFAREHPTVSVDGCNKLCAKNAITKYSAKVAASVNIEDLLKEWGEEAPKNRRELSKEEIQLAHKISKAIGTVIDGLSEVQP